MSSTALAAGLELPSASRSPWQWLYRAAHRRRVHYYASRSTQLAVPVVSVGNLHWGGTGKTPIVISIAAHLRDAGSRVCVLSRGYASHGRGTRIVSRGDGPLLGPSLAGDEPVLLAGALEGVSVVVAKDRAVGAAQASQRLDPAPDLFVLDDGFSHLRVQRTLDLLVLPRSDPFGGGRLPPGGRLREPLEAAARAHAVLLSGGAPGEGAVVAAELSKAGFRGAGFSVAMRTQSPVNEEGVQLARGERVVLVTGIARAHRVVEAARSHGLEIACHLELRDHQQYTRARLRHIRRRFHSCGATHVLTTTKDAVKLRGRIDLPMAELPLEAVIEESFWPWLSERLESA